MSRIGEYEATALEEIQDLFYESIEATDSANNPEMVEIVRVNSAIAGQEA